MVPACLKQNRAMREYWNYKREKFVNSKKAAFLSAFSQLGVLTAAAKRSKVNRRSHFRWMKKDPAYAAAFLVAEDRAIEVMESEARRRAVKGTVKPVFWKGKRCGGIREFSDLLMIFLLKAKRPAIYRENPRQAGESTDRLAELFSAKAAGPIERGETP